MDEQNKVVNLVPGVGGVQTYNCSQGDIGRTLEFTIINGSSVYSIPSDATVTVAGTKPSGMGFSEVCTITADGTAKVDTTEAMTQEPGRIWSELRIVDADGANIGTANFVLAVEKSPHDASVTDGTIAEAKTIFERADEAMTKAEEMIEKVDVYNSIVEEVEDIRVGVDGKAYDSAGDAVRGQVSDLKEDFTQLQDNLYTGSTSANLLYLNNAKPNYYISNTTGEEIAYNNWGATDYMPVVGGEDYVFIGCYSVGGTYEYIRTDYYAFYDSQKTYISGGFNSRGAITAPANAAFIRESTNLPAFTSAMYATMFGLNSDLAGFVGQKTKADYIEPATTLSPSDFLVNTVNDIVGHTVRVETDGSGDFTTLKDAIEYSALHEDTTICVGNGTYDLITEFGSSYFENMTSSSQRQGLQIGNGVHIIFSSGSKVTAHYTGDNDAVKTCFSPFNFIQGSKGFILENLTLEASNVRYAVHDEAGSTSTPNHYKNVYKNCRMTIDNSQNASWLHHQCIGGGLGLHGEIIIEDCIFTDLYNINYRVPAVSYHNAAGAGARSRIIVKGCWFSKDATVRASWYGTSTEITEAIVHDNSMTVPPYANAEGSSAIVENVQLLAWNNEIRSV